MFEILANLVSPTLTKVQLFIKDFHTRQFLTCVVILRTLNPFVPWTCCKHIKSLHPSVKKHSREWSPRLGSCHWL